MSDQRREYLRVSAQAKLNLGLEIITRRPDGYHEIVSVTQTLSLADTVEYAPGDPFSVEMRPPLAGDEQNIAVRAGLALAEFAEAAPAGRITIAKRIPLAAGLGGGSSDAAATLRLLNRAWGTGRTPYLLSTIGASIGSDVPLFLMGGASLIRGRGEIVEPLVSPPTFWAVLMRPDLDVAEKTRALYGALSPGDFSDGARTLALAEAIRARRPVDGSLLVNGFSAAADRVYPDFAALRTDLADRLGAPVHLTGAGPTLFAIFDRPEPARAAARRARRKGLTIHVASSTVGLPPIRASRVAFAR